MVGSGVLEDGVVEGEAMVLLSLCMAVLGQLTQAKVI